MLDELRRLYAAGKLVPFVGAGASKAVRWLRDGREVTSPTWDELVDRAALLLGFEKPSFLLARGTPLQVLEYFRLRNGLAPLTNWLVREVDAPNSAIQASVIHKALAGLTGCPIFYTTNYDDYIERALGLFGRQCQVIVEEQDMGAPAADCSVVKFHGDFNHPTEMVLSESHYENRLNFQNPLDLRLRSDMLGRTILFIGYSFRDPNVAYLFHMVQKHLVNKNSGKRAYILFPEPSDFERKLFTARDIGVLSISRRDLEHGVADLLSRLAS